jgi:hypothetical protein
VYSGEAKKIELKEKCYEITGSWKLFWKQFRFVGKARKQIEFSDNF